MPRSPAPSSPARLRGSGLAGAALLAAALFGCSSSPAAPAAPACAEPPFAQGRLSTRCGQLVDAEGRVVFLHGINARVEGIFDVTFADGRAALEPIPPFPAADAALARAMGFNALRLPVNWSALEPRDGAGFDEAYLAKVGATVDVAGAAGLGVLLDLHQDGYSKEIGEDGAPLWAIVPRPKKLLGGPLTDLGTRRLSPAVLDAFTTFFGDAADGRRLRTRYAAAAAHVAAHFAGHPSVIGIEIYNEPLAGLPAALDALHDEVIAAIRAVDPGRLVFFEPDALRNVTGSAPLASRAPWPGTVYAPHVYTLAFTGSDDEHRAMTRETLAPGNQAARAEADSWSAPLAITEFGYDPAGIQADSYLAWQVALQDENLASGFFWVWKEQSQGRWGLFDHDDKTGAWKVRDHVQRALSRPVVEAITGFPTRLGYDAAAGRFELDFTGDGDPMVGGGTELFLPPDGAFASGAHATCDGAIASLVVKVQLDGAGRPTPTGFVETRCGGPGPRQLVITR